MKGIPAGNLNRLIRIQERAFPRTVDSLNEPVVAWTTIITCYADIKGTTGLGSIRDRNESGLSSEANAYSFRIRYRPAVDNAMRVLLDDTRYEIRQVRHDLANRVWTDLVCEVGVNAD